MKWLILFVLILNFQIKSDELWQKALKIVEKSKEYIPEEMELDSTIYNFKGGVLSKYNIIFKLSLNEKGELISEPEKITLNERDVTKDYKEKIKKAKSNDETKYIFSDEYDIFQMENQKNLNYYASGKEKIRDFDYAVYTFFQKLKKNDILQKGFVYLNSKNGKPYKIVYTLEPLPLDLDEMSIALYYSDRYEDLALLEKAEIDGFGKIQLYGYQASLSFKSKFKIIFLFSNYFLSTKKIKK